MIVRFAMNPNPTTKVRKIIETQAKKRKMYKKAPATSAEA